MKRLLIIAALLTIGASICKAQTTDTNGIHFERKLPWFEILAKAKAEHKYIFVDCYAIWCGPCKQMDANVYPVKEVGDAYNEDFISVKIQMDKTKADDSLTRSNYKTAMMLQEDYNINAYPTFLFFDPDGKPVHKVIGSLDAKQFIALANDARNPDKQYYTVLKNFQPGKLDTAEEKSLARKLGSIDQNLGAKLALDYLSRIPKQRLRTYASGQLMFWYQKNPAITDFAVNYLHSMNKKEFASQATLDLMRALLGQVQIRQIAVNYISHLSNKEVGEEKNMDFITQFPGDSTVKQVAKRFITEMPDQSIKSKNARWYHYLVYDLKEGRYWPQLVDADMDRLAKFADQSNLTNPQAQDINNTCDEDVFLHSDDTAKINLAIKLMKKVFEYDIQQPKSYAGYGSSVDTYACLLYKAGRTPEALALEQQVLDWCIANEARGTATIRKRTILTIEKMKAGEKIWLEKEFQD